MPRLTRPEDRQRQKANAIEYEKRVETVRRLLLSPMETSEIIPSITERWGIKPRMARLYIVRANKRNQAIASVGRIEMFAEHVAIRRDIRRRAQAAGDRKMELAAARDEAQLIGLYAATQVEIHDWREQARKDGYDPDKLLAEFRAAMARGVSERSIPATDPEPAADAPNPS